MPTEDYRPSLEDVGAISLVRTVDNVGIQVGTFTADTRPTDSQVEILIDKALGELGNYIGADIPEVLWPAAIHVASKYTAMLIELTLYAHEIRANISSYPTWKELYDQELAQLVLAVQSLEAGDAFGNLARFGFPPPTFIYVRPL